MALLVAAHRCIVLAAVRQKGGGNNTVALFAWLHCIVSNNFLICTLSNGILYFCN